MPISFIFTFRILQWTHPVPHPAGWPGPSRTLQSRRPRRAMTVGDRTDADRPRRQSPPAYAAHLRILFPRRSPTRGVTGLARRALVEIDLVAWMKA